MNNNKTRAKPWRFAKIDNRFVTDAQRKSGTTAQTMMNIKKEKIYIKESDKVY